MKIYKILSIFKHYRLLLFCLTISSFTGCSSSNDLRFKSFLEGLPKYGINKEKPDYYKAHSGTFPYGYHEGKAYIMLGQEKNNMEWSEFGGKYSKEDRNFTENLSRELCEETSGLYCFPSEKFRQQSTYYLYQDKTDKKIEVVYAFVKVDELIDKKSLKSAQALEKNPAFLEKMDIIWVDVQDLLKKINQKTDNKKLIRVKTLSGKTEDIKIRRFFYEDFILHPYLKQLLKLILENNNR